MKTKLPPLPKTGERRLLKLIAFLEKLPRRKFDFRYIARQADTPKCGTVCCAMGWTSSVFPKRVKLVLDAINPEYSDLVSRVSGVENYDRVALELFGMDQYTANDLFYPDNQDLVHESLPNCTDSATPKQVAKMLRKYLALTKEAA